MRSLPGSDDTRPIVEVLAGCQAPDGSRPLTPVLPFLGVDEGALPARFSGVPASAGGFDTPGPLPPSPQPNRAKALATTMTCLMRGRANLEIRLLMERAPSTGLIMNKKNVP